ncbi:aldehyde ferredoxin oxidoreductase N-terminal domain-containing protein [Caldisphaera sp.]|uniref:aldehyde ferredoxin oxidoreductase N-terminal domain-containing protein n=1 Tax=Caldisphaera sp. TaxID=2060322 RepID=UPI00397E1020
MKFRSLYIDVSKGSYNYNEEDDQNILGIIDYGLKIHMGSKSYLLDPLDPNNPIVFGIGPFAGGIVIGSHRIVFIFKSPVSTGIHVSELGGAGFAFFRTGLDGVVINGKSSEPSIITIYSSDKGLDVKIDHIREDELWNVYNGYEGYKGTRGLTQYIISKNKDNIIKNKSRVIVVGPAAFKTKFAGIFSYVLDEHTAVITPVSDSASRGGGGTVLAKAHNVVGIVVGGTLKRDNPNLGNIKLMNQISQNIYKKQYMPTLLEKTVKYRFDPQTKTGGTFGVNYIHYKELVPCLGYNNVYYSRGVRLILHEKVIENYWKPFEDNVFDGGKLTDASKNCGEPCSVSCKKIYKGTKIDYEPAHGVGPISGIITMDESANLVNLLDDLGLDAIEAGHLISWIFDLIDKGLLNPEDVGLNDYPVFDPERIDKEASIKNSILAKKLIELIGFDENNKVLKTISERGLRSAAKELDNIYHDRISKIGLKYEDLLVYAAFGKEGYMTPNYYWSPGVLAPLYVLGKYWTDYSPSFKEPEDYETISLKRAVLEYIVANAGFCRFHRGWAEEMMAEMYKQLIGLNVDLYSHGLKMYKTIADYQLKSGAEPEFWESKKVMDIVASMAAETGATGWEDSMYHKEKLKNWWERFYNKLNQDLSKVSL